MVLGGLESGSYANATSSIAMIGFDNCSVPDLPETRYHHGGFVTSWGSLAVCGGYGLENRLPQTVLFLIRLRVSGNVVFLVAFLVMLLLELSLWMLERT